MLLLHVENLHAERQHAGNRVGEKSSFCIREGEEAHRFRQLVSAARELVHEFWMIKQSLGQVCLKVTDR